MEIIKFRDILDAVRNAPDLAPHDGMTFCNVALDRVLGLCGIPRIVTSKGEPMLANDMIDFIENSPDWKKVDGQVACARASQGILVVACQCEVLHGHVCPVYPSPMGYSASWQKEVPIVSNVGKTVGVMRASQAFRTEPDYYGVKI